MFGKNPIRKPEKGDGSTLQVVEIFPTFQGEGPLAGTPAVFVRLGGCNLACAFCDTEFEDFEPWGLDDILKEVQSLARNQDGERVRALVVITGGEPLRQPIEKLCDGLLDDGFQVQIETNGTLMRPLDARVQIVCSPKAGAMGYSPVREDVLERSLALKFLISKYHPHYDVVPDVGQTAFDMPVYLQPMDEYDADKNAENLAYVSDISKKTGARISLQLHKIAGVR